MSQEKRLSLREILRRKPVLVGCALDSAVPAFVEMAGRVGFDVVWLDLEHYRRSPRETEAFCIACDASGAMPLLRVADASRESILPALEMGARFVVVPMVESAQTARQIVQWGKFAPLGGRGYNGATRGMHYALESRLPTMDSANEQTYLFPQIESLQGVQNCAEIVGVDGIEGALVGPADLSISAGMPLDFTNPAFRALFRSAIQAICGQGKIAAVATAHPDLVDDALDCGAQIILCASDMAAVREHLKDTYLRHQQLVSTKSLVPNNA